MKNHLVPCELTLTRVSISSRLPCQVLLCLLLTFACSLRAANPVYVGVGYGLLKSTDAGATWNLLNVPLNTPFLSGYVRPQFLAMDPQNTSKIYFVGSAGGTALFASSDAGATWTATPFIGLQPTHLAVDFAGQAIYISASPTRGTTYVYKSTNTGASWTQLPCPAQRRNHPAVRWTKFSRIRPFQEQYMPCRTTDIPSLRVRISEALGPRSFKKRRLGNLPTSIRTTP